MPADGELDFDHVGRVAEHRVDIAITLADDRRFAGMARRKLGRAACASSSGGSSSISAVDQIGGVLGDIGIDGEHCGDRIADIAHAVCRQHRLAIGIERRDRALAEIDRRHFGDVGGGPHRIDAGQRARRRGVDPDDAAMRMRRAHDAHMKLVREIDVAGKRAAPATSGGSSSRSTDWPIHSFRPREAGEGMSVRVVFDPAFMSCDQPRLSCPAQAGHPVIAGRVGSTGSSAFADDDNVGKAPLTAARPAPAPGALPRARGRGGIRRW